MKTVNTLASRRVAGKSSRFVKFYTLGCKVNQYDTQVIREQFIRNGFKEPDNDRSADICVINTCTVTGSADCDSLGLVRKARRQNPGSMVIVTGCLAELNEKLIKGIDKNIIVIKNKGKARLVERLVGADNPLSAGISYFKGHTRAFLKIQEGCDNFCAYCKVPLVRGISRSRPLDDIIKEADRLAKNGIKEIVLTGICLGSYGKDLSGKAGLVSVIEAIEKIPGVCRVRLSSIEAGDVSDELIYKISASKKLCPHLHIPLQSGDDRILKKMNRKYTSGRYLSLVKKIKGHIPAIAITTDCLVGFPGETEDNFQNTADLIRRIQPLKSHIFPYSKREGTLAAKYHDEEIPPVVIKERCLRLKKIADECSFAYKRQFLGSCLDVLIECRSKENEHTWEGHAGNYIRICVKSNLDLKNELISAKIKKIGKEMCEAKFLKQ